MGVREGKGTAKPSATVTPAECRPVMATRLVAAAATLRGVAGVVPMTVKIHLNFGLCFAKGRCWGRGADTNLRTGHGGGLGTSNGHGYGGGFGNGRGESESGAGGDRLGEGLGRPLWRILQYSNSVK